MNRISVRSGSLLSFGTPDLALPGKKVAVFVDGCFWHGCPEHYFAPKSRARFWAEKLRENVIRPGEVPDPAW
jgi:DNA mismatch endonuclease, patch repair protein